MRRLFVMLALLALAPLTVGAFSPTAASASPCQLQPRGGNWPGTLNWSASGNSRSVCFVSYIEGAPGQRYYAIGFDDQDLIDTGTGGDTHWVCWQYATPGNLVWKTAVCDYNSADWVKNGTGSDWKLVVDSWASGGPCGFHVRVIASDAAYTNGTVRAGGPNDVIKGCWW